MPEYPPIADLLPHRAPMLLLERVLSGSGEHLTCAVQVRADGLFDRGGRVPAWLGLEYMAQTIAALSGWEAHRQGRLPRVGFLLGTRRFHTSAPDFGCGATLEVTARRVLEASSGMAAFDCTLHGEGIEQQARLSVFEPADADHYLEQQAR